MSDNWSQDESPLSDPGFICVDGDPGCWCLFRYGSMTLCYCKRCDCRGTPKKRRKWNGKSY